MYYLVGLISCLLMMLFHNEHLVEAVNFYDIQDDLAKFNIACYGDNCTDNQGGSLSYRACLCGIECVQLGACCADSIYADVQQPKLKHACRSVNENQFYFMIDQCPYDSVWTNLCNVDWNGEDDVQKLVPVTSLSTSNTYKNYYCLRCHETSDDFLYWKVKIQSDFTHYEKPQYGSEQSYENILLTYDKDMGTWMAIYDENIGYFPVNLDLQIPEKISKLVHFCEPKLISDCSDNWNDGEVESKCHSYMSIKETERMGKTLKYKNIHCAICNFQNVNDLLCKTTGGASAFGEKIFSFTYLLDINRSDGDMVGKIQKCSEDNIWDPYTKKCRKLTCALPGHKVKNGKCVRE